MVRLIASVACNVGALWLIVYRRKYNRVAIRRQKKIMSLTVKVYNSEENNFRLSLRLRSTDTVMCVVRRSNNTFGDRCFASAGPRLWNTLPPHLRQCDSLGQFKRLLKTHLFGS